jgi:hypothetical protein
MREREDVAIRIVFEHLDRQRPFEELEDEPRLARLSIFLPMLCAAMPP